MDESFCPFENFRWPVEILDLAHADSDSALMTLRRKRSRPETSMDWSGDGETWQQWEVPDNSSNIEDLYLKKEADLKLKEAIERLRPPLRSVMEIQRLHYRSNKEVADAAGISVTAVKSRLLRARALLRSSLRSSRSSTQQPDTAPLNQETERTARLVTRRNRSSATDRIVIPSPAILAEEKLVLDAPESTRELLLES